MGCRLMKTKPLTEKSELNSPVFPTFGVQAITMTTAATMAPNLRLSQRARFRFFAHLFAFVYKTTRKVITSKIQGFETEHKQLAMKHQIQNARVQS